MNPHKAGHELSHDLFKNIQLRNFMKKFSAFTRVQPSPIQHFSGGLLLVLWLSLAWATPAGTVIRNQALAIVNGQTYLSNEIETIIQAVCVPSLTPNGTSGAPAQSAVVSAGGWVYFAYLLRNSGNQSFTFDLGWAQDSAPWSPVGVKLYHDANGNAQLDAGEMELSQATLAPAQEIRLLLGLQTPLTAAGNLHIGPVATCPDGTRDSDNLSRVGIGSGAALNVIKSVDATQAQEGQVVGFRIRVWNLGNARTEGPIYVSDWLDKPELRNLTYVMGSGSAAKGRLEYSDGSTWSTLETQVRGIRLVLEGLEAGEEAFFSFQMQVEAGATPGDRLNLVTLESASSRAQATAGLQIMPRYAHALGPLDNPEAMGAADEQSARVLAGQPYCFRHTLLNNSNADDLYSLEAVGLPGGVGLSFRTLAGGSLPQPIVLPAGSRQSFAACLTGLPASTAPFAFTLLARSAATGQTDPTLNRVLQVLDPSLITLRKSTRTGPTVTPGERVVYTLEIENPLPIALENVLVEDVLDAGLEFVSASEGGTYTSTSRTVRWNLTLAAGSTRTLNLEARVASSAPNGAVIPNRFSLRADAISNPLLSNTVSLNVLASVLLLEKQVQPNRASVGDLLTYAVTVVNVGPVALTVRLEDTPEAGLLYLPGSATPGEPLLQGNRLIWDNLTLAPGARMVVSYKMRVGAGVGPSLRNTVQAIGSAGSNAAVASAVASAVVQLQQGVFTPPHSLLGRVFLDTDRDGRFTTGLDVPLPGARVLLSNGLQTLTDSEGRYSFRNLPGGLFEVMLEPASAPFQPLPHPEALGRSPSGQTADAAVHPGGRSPSGQTADAAVHPGGRSPSGQTADAAVHPGGRSPSGQTADAAVHPGGRSPSGQTADAAVHPGGRSPSGQTADAAVHPGDGYRHRVRVEGLTVSDFPLERPTGLARAMRETTLEFGPLRVEKKLLPLPSGIRVVLVLNAAETLTDLTLTDPLPGGGERVFRFAQFQGTQTLTYDLPGGFLTDPQARWRYP
ncbi:hypothetical protein [Meiothermus sp.]|uniref:hypothetical protein n=1 Tax=Meiothermus sp. TaxID=1955249 RepID=UPI0021DC1CF7|nr:hypothetical protein [Meiothermus sp.]GIW33198.1 MAG: hypothetical protein KatS3mg072_0531 [Meiothermus sp.]